MYYYVCENIQSVLHVWDYYRTIAFVIYNTEFLLRAFKYYVLHVDVMMSIPTSTGCANYFLLCRHPAWYAFFCLVTMTLGLATVLTWPDLTSYILPRDVKTAIAIMPWAVVLAERTNGNSSNIVHSEWTHSAIITNICTAYFKELSQIAWTSINNRNDQTFELPSVFVVQITGMYAL